MKAKIAGVNFDVGTKEELFSLKRDTELVSSFCTEMAETMQVHTAINSVCKFTNEKSFNLNSMLNY